MTPEELERAHRALAPSLFNRVWELMDKKDRTEDETDEMLHSAQASRHHWTLARAHAMLGNKKEARMWRDKAEHAGDIISEQEDKDFFNHDLATIDAIL